MPKAATENEFALFENALGDKILLAQRVEQNPDLWKAYLESLPELDEDSLAEAGRWLAENPTYEP